MPRQGAASGHHGESPDCCIACFHRQRQANSLIQANMVAYALARRIAPRHPLSWRGSPLLISCWRPADGRADALSNRSLSAMNAPPQRPLRSRIPAVTGSAAECRNSRCFAENSNRNPLRAVHKKCAKNGRRAPPERRSRSKPPSDWLPTAACVLFVQHSPEKDRR